MDEEVSVRGGGVDIERTRAEKQCERCRGQRSYDALSQRTIRKCNGFDTLGRKFAVV